MCVIDIAMKLSDFDFDLPKELLAEYPTAKREESRLMVLHRATQKIEHKSFKEVIDHFGQEDLLLLNNTKVFPARLRGTKEKTGASVEVFLLKELDVSEMTWEVMVSPARKMRIGTRVLIGKKQPLLAEVVDNTQGSGRIVKFLFEGIPKALKAKMHQLGEAPIPKYIKRPVEDLDKQRYQTVYAKEEGAVAAPTAGLHFSHDLMQRLESKGVDFEQLTLHIGLGTFNPVRVEEVEDHQMDAEQFCISDAFAAKVNHAIAHQKRVCAVGTTVMRAIESSVNADGLLEARQGWTQKFIYPPYDFSIANAMITNFHIPKSTLIMMIAAFAGRGFVMHAYREAVKEKYRFYTYGDAMLIL